MGTLLRVLSENKELVGTWEGHRAGPRWFRIRKFCVSINRRESNMKSGQGVGQRKAAD